MKRLMIFFWAVLLPCLLAAQSAQQPVLLQKDSLETKRGMAFVRGWDFQPGDSLNWNAVAAPDSTAPWYALQDLEALSSFGKKVKNFQGVGWLRYRFRTDSVLYGVPLAMNLVQYGASEVYINGKQLAKTGSFSGNGGAGKYNYGRKAIVFALPDTGTAELMVKFENTALTWNTEQAGDETFLDIRVFTAEKALRRQSESNGQSLVLIITVAFLSFFFFHLILFLFYRKDLSNLFFCLFNLGMGLIFLVIYKVVSAEYTEEDNLQYIRTALIALAVSGLALSGLVNNLFSRFGVRFRIIAALCLVSSALMWFSDDIASYAICIIFTLIMIEVVFLLIRAYLKKVQGAAILAGGVLIDFLCVAIIIALLVVNGGELVIDGNRQLLGFVFSILVALMIFSIPISMSVYLAWKTAYTNRQLSMQIAQVESLSKEKQDILEHQKELLEKEVEERTAELSFQKKKSDDLLLNILPGEVAEELKEKGNAAARHFNNVTVLFSDFVNFTGIAEASDPETLVEELHAYFKTFDAIMERHGLEKIKTIGDAYLAVSGLPVEHGDHARKAVLAARDMMDHVTAMLAQGHRFHMRIGINSGPLVAGIVGVKKFAYDIWGDTVNIASRMESHGVPGKINISEHTWQLVHKDFTCTHRGRIEVKNKGAMDMYFVEAGLVQPEHQIF